MWCTLHDVSLSSTFHDISSGVSIRHFIKYWIVLLMYISFYFFTLLTSIIQTSAFSYKFQTQFLLLEDCFASAPYFYLSFCTDPTQLLDPEDVSHTLTYSYKPLTFAVITGMYFICFMYKYSSVALQTKWYDICSSEISSKTLSFPITFLYISSFVNA